MRAPGNWGQRRMSLVQPLPISWPTGAGVTHVATPMSFGLDLPAGTMREGSGIQIELPNGVTLPAQATILGIWHDGSVRWLLVDCVIPEGVPLEGVWHLFFETRKKADAAEVVGREGAGAIQFDTDEWTLSLDKRTGGWTAASGQQLLAKAALPELTDGKGRRHLAAVKRVRLLAAGPVRATVEVEAEYRRLRGLRLVARW